MSKERLYEVVELPPQAVMVLMIELSWADRNFRPQQVAQHVRSHGIRIGGEHWLAREERVDVDGVQVPVIRISKQRVAEEGGGVLATWDVPFEGWDKLILELPVVREVTAGQPALIH